MLHAGETPASPKVPLQCLTLRGANEPETGPAERAGFVRALSATQTLSIHSESTFSAAGIVSDETRSVQEILSTWTRRARAGKASKIMLHICSCEASASPVLACGVNNSSTSETQAQAKVWGHLETSAFGNGESALFGDSR